MAFPVDLLTNVDLESLEVAAKEYMSQLPYRDPEYLSPPGSKQIEIGLCNVSFVPLYGEDAKKKLLALFSPDDSKTVVGLYLLGRWWGVEDVLKTAEPSRTGLIKVSTLGERIVLYVLNRIVLRTEKSAEDVSFLCHCEHESAKILWKDGEAIGFYSFKPKGSLCINFLTQCYQLPVMDTVFVRKCHRGKGHGMQILDDFVGSFRKENVGLKFPLSEAMYKVCEKHLRIYPADEELLWEVEKIGSPFQRTLIAKRLQKLKLKDKDQVVSKLNFEEDDATAPMETEITKIQETAESTVEILEETITDITKEEDEISNLKRRGIRENSEELNRIRVEHIEAGVESPMEVEIEENLDVIFSVKESEAVLRTTSDTVTATMIGISELRDSQEEEEQEIGKDIVTAISQGTPVTHVTTVGEIKSQRGNEDDCGIVKEHTEEIQGATIGSIDQSQLQPVVDIEIVMMSTGIEEEQNETLENNRDVEKDETVCVAESGEIKQMLKELEQEKAVSETAEEVAEQPEIHAELTEEEQAHWDVEITERIERSEDEVLEECGKDLPEENRDNNIGAEKCESKDEYTVLLQSVEIEDQSKMEVHCMTEAICTEEVLCDEHKKNEAETEVSEPNQAKSNKDTLIEEEKRNKPGPEGAEQIFTQRKLPQKRTSTLTPSRKSKRLRHQPAETYVRSTKTVKTTQQKSKQMVQKEDTKQSIDKPEHDSSKGMEKSSVKNKAESEVEEYKEYDNLTVETVSTMDAEITQLEETGDVVPNVCELVERAEIDPQQSSVELTEVRELRTTLEKDEETVKNSTITLTLSEAKVVLVDLHKFPPKEAGDNRGEMDIAEHDEIRHTVSIKQQVPEEAMKMDEQDGTMDTEPMEKPACTTASEESNVAADGNIIQGQSAAYKEQEGEPELETPDDVLKSQVEKPDGKTDTEQTNEEDSYEASKSQNKGFTDTPCEMANTNVDGTAAGAPGSSELLKTTETDDNEKEPQITEATKNDSPFVEAEPDNVTEKAVEEIRRMEKKETNLTRQTHSDTELSSLVQEKDVQEQEASVSTDRSLRRRTIRVQSPPRRKSRHVQKQGGKADVGHQEKNTAESKNKTISMTEERVEEMDQAVKTTENKDPNLEPGTQEQQHENELLVENDKVTAETEKPMEMDEDPVDGKEQPYVVEGTTVQIKEKVSQVESTETNQSDHEGITRRSLRLGAKAVTSTQKTRKSTRLHKEQYVLVTEADMGRNEYEENLGTSEETPVITVETTLENISKTNVEETLAVEPETSELIMGEEIDDKVEEIIEEVSLEKAEPEEKVERDDVTPVIQLQKATVVLVDLNTLCQNTEGISYIREVPMHFQTEENLELDKQINSEHQLCDLTSEGELQELQKEDETEKTPEEEKIEEENTAEEQNEPDKQDMIYEGPKQTEDLEEQNDVTEKRIDENCRAIISGEHQETKTMVDKTSIIQEAEKDQAVALKEKQTDCDVEKSGFPQEAPEAVQEILEEEAPVSTERRLRRRTIKVHSPPRRKSRRVQKQESEASEDKIRKVPITGKGVEEMHDENAKIDDKEETPQKSTVNATEMVIPLVEAEPEECEEKVVEEINKIENKETNLITSSEQQENEPLVENDKVTAETEKPMEMDEDPVDGKEQPYVVEGTTVQIKEKVSQEESTETNQSDHEGIIRKSAKAVTSTQKTRKSTRLHKEQYVLVTETDMSRNEYEENSGTSEETPIITVETTLESLDEISNTNVEETPAVEPETSELIMGEEIDDKVEEIVEEVPLEPEEKVQEDDGTPVIQLQKATVILEDLNTLCQNTAGDSVNTEVPKKSQAEKNLEEDKPANSDHLCNLTPEEEEQQELQKRKDLEVQNDVRETEIVEEHKEVIDEEAITFGEHQEATTIADKICIIQESENDQAVALKEKQTDSDVEMSGLPHKAPEAVQDILEEEASVSTERSLRRRTIKVHSPQRRKSRRVQKQEALEDKTGIVPITRKGERAKIKVTLPTSTGEVTEEKIPPEPEPPENTESIDNEVTPEMGRKEANLEQQENQSLVENEKESAQTEKPMEMDEDPVVNKEQTYVIEELNFCVPIITAETNVTVDGDIVSMSKVEADSDKHEIDISKALPDTSTDIEQDEPESSIKTAESEILVEMDKTQKGLEEGVQDEEKTEPPQKNTDQEREENILDKGEDEIGASSVEEDTTQQDKAVSQEENEGEINLTNEFKILSEQEVPIITRSLRSRTVTAQSTPTRKSKRLHRQEVESEKETKDYIYSNERDSAIPQPAEDLNIPIEKENEALNTEESTAKFEHLATKEQEDIIQVNTDGSVVETGTKDDTVAQGNEILSEIMESNSGSLENNDSNKTHEDNLEKEDVQVPKEHIEEEVSNVHAEEIENESAGVQGGSSDLEETVERRTLRKRATFEEATSRKSKRLRKQECDENSKQVRESVIEQTESIEVTFTADNVELRSDVPAAVFEGSHLGEEILQDIQKAAEETQSDNNILTETDAGESQVKQKGERVNKTHEDDKEENSKLLEETDDIEEVIDQHFETEEHLESRANDSFTLELETEDSYTQEENKADKESSEAMEAEKNISDYDEKGLTIEKYVLQSSSATASTRQKSMGLQMSDSEESEPQQTAKQRRQRKRKAITDSTPSRRSNRHVRAKIV